MLKELIKNLWCWIAHNNPDDFYLSGISTDGQAVFECQKCGATRSKPLRKQGHE